jgi:hypothetical protein
MFFSLGSSIDHRFPNHDTVDGWVFNYDNGWCRQDQSWYKGYQHSDIGYGNWTRITVQGSHVQLHHGALRGYPLWWDREQRVLTNLCGSGQRIWADESIEIQGDQAHIPKVDIFGNINLEPLTMNQVLHELAADIRRKVSALDRDYHDNVKRLFLTGGVDTLLLFAFARAHGLQFDLVDHEHFEYDWFTNHALHNIRDRHWAYGQMHHWREPTMFLTGSCGDEFTFRGPNIIALWCAWHDIDVLNMLPQAQGYHVGYFQKPHNVEIFQQAWQSRHILRRRYPHKQDLVRQILDINANDHQHWHLGNTVTWSPFMDLEITKTILRLPEQHILSHIMDASVSKNLITLALPHCLSWLSQTKNYDQRKSLTHAA